MSTSFRRIHAVALAAFAMAVCGRAAAEQAAPRRPNVVVFLADDAGWGDYGHSGNRQASTPHIDGIARDGVTLDRFFVCPLCSPTLTALAGVRRVGDKPLDGRDLSPLLLKQPADWPERMIFSTWGGRTSVRTQRHRLDHRGQLFDMLEDPGQTTPINDREPRLASELAADVKAWREDLFGPGAAATGGKGKGNAIDPRPFPVGYREFPIAMLPARDSEPHGGIRRSSPAPNCSYFVVPLTNSRVAFEPISGATFAFS